MRLIWAYISSSLCCQDAADGSAPDLHPTSVLDFAYACTVELSYLLSVEARRYGSAQALAVLAGVGQAGADSFAGNLPFELHVLQFFAKRG